ncbi:MAG TPA: cytidine deaminase [Longimicrobiales bacterium]|nr:cytidine deaminase [Longimicrobiales bacterium]
MEPDALLEAARSTMALAYAPYSGFRVGAALEAEDGSVHTACNVENASYGLTVCAERAAVFRAVAEGKRAFRRIAIVTEGRRAVAPCGACRQVLSEFGTGLEVVSEAGGERRAWSLAELLPAPFHLPPPASEESRAK